MRAALVTGHGGLDRIAIVTDHPDPLLGPDDAIVAVSACGLNFHDVFTRRGMPGIRIPLPIITGSDIAGTVAALGSAVEGWAVGDRVLIDPVVMQEDRFALIGEMLDGGRAERVAVPARNLIRVPDAVSLEDAAALPLAYGTAWRMMVTRAAVQPDETVLVLGASGGVGVAAVQIAKLYGAKVIAAVGSADKGKRLLVIGADHVVDYRGGRLREQVHAIVGKPRVVGTGGVDLAVNFTGGDSWPDTQKCVKLGGRIVTCGATAGFDCTFDARYLWTYEQTFIGSDGWGPGDLETLLDAVASGRLKPVIDRILPLEDAAEAERIMESRELVGKILLRP